MKPGDIVYVRCVVTETTHDALSVARVFRPTDYAACIGVQPVSKQREREGPAILIPKPAIVTDTQLHSAAVAMIHDGKGPKGKG